MFFLLRVGFWLTVVLVVLPSLGSQPAAKGPQFGATEAAVAAGAAMADMSNFCDRQAEACVVGAQAAAVIGHRAQTGARMVYDFISEKVVHDKGDRIETGSITASLLTHADGQNTLTASDLEAPWRGPEPRKQGHKQADKPAKPHKQAQPVKAVKESAKEAAKTTEKKPG